MPASAFTPFGLTRQDVARLRERFAAWPREAAAADTLTGQTTSAGQPVHGTASDERARDSAETGTGRPRLGRPYQAEQEDPELEP